MAFRFSGGSWLTFGGISLSLPLSIACFFKPNAVGVNNLLLHLRQDSGSGNRHDLYSLGGSGNKIGVRTSSTISGYTAFGVTTTTYLNDEWAFAVGTFYNSTSRVAFLDGGGAGGNYTSRPLFTSTWGGIGGIGDVTIARAMFYSASLSGASMGSLINGVDPREVQPESLMAYFPLNDDLYEVYGNDTPAGYFLYEPEPTFEANPPVIPEETNTVFMKSITFLNSFGLV